MPLPALPPLVLAAAKYGTVAVAAWALTRETYRGRTDQRAEDAMDDLPDGISIRQPEDRMQTNVAARIRRRVGFGSAGLHVDVAILARLRVRAR